MASWDIAPKSVNSFVYGPSGVAEVAITTAELCAQLSQSLTYSDTAMMYWLTNAGASSARLYWESFNSPDMGEVTLPTGISLFPNEIMRSSERWARKKFLDLMYFNDKIEAGGHFAALEVPETLAGELWRWRQELRTRGIVD